jgi:hypothetical protein
MMQTVLNGGRLAGASLNALGINAAFMSGQIVGAVNSLTSAIRNAAARFNAMRPPSVGGSIGTISVVPKIDGSHADGLPYVPKDGYIAELHQGERVLTARENAAYSRGGGSNGGISISGITINVNGANKSGRQLAEEIADDIGDILVRKIIAASEAGA